MAEKVRGRLYEIRSFLDGGKRKVLFKRRALL